MQTDSVFTKIIKSEIPAYKIYEDEQTLAFLDIHPIQPGMTLVVTKKQIEDFTQLEPADLATWMNTVQKVARRMQQVFPNKKRIGVQIEGLDVPHVHAKVFPIDSGAEFHAQVDDTAEPDHQALAKMAEKLRF